MPAVILTAQPLELFHWRRGRTPSFVQISTFLQANFGTETACRRRISVPHTLDLFVWRFLDARPRPRRWHDACIVSEWFSTGAVGSWSTHRRKRKKELTMKISKRKQLVVVAVFGLTLGPWMAAMSSAASRSKKSAVSQRSRVTPFRTTRKMSRQSTGPARTYSGTRASGAYTVHNPSRKQTDRNSGRTSRHEGRYRRDRNSGRTSGHDGRYRRDRHSGRTSGHDGRYRRDRHSGNQGRFYWRWPRALSTKPFLPRPRIPTPQIYPPSPRVTEIERPEIQQPDTESPVVDSKPDG